MATVRQPKPISPAKYDAYVEEQLNKARRRIRLLDVSSALLILVAAAFVYILVVGLLDRRLELSAVVRQVTLIGFTVAVVAFLGWAVLRPLFRRVNPYFAARAIEQVVPGAKNSVVNWLDLHDETLPPAIRASLSQRAAKDLGQVDLEQAISGRRAVWLTAVAALLAFVLFGLLVTSGLGAVGTLMSRIFAPFGSGAAAKRTQLTLVRPANGDTNLGLGQSFEVAVQVDGHVPDANAPDALKLLFRNRDDDSYEEQVLSPENGAVWMTVLPATRIFGNFSYKIKGGDAETPEYHVTIRGTPQVEQFDVTYHHRAYTGWPDRFTHDGNLHDLRGTEVELLLRTDRPVKEGHLDIETRAGKRTIAAELVRDNPQAMRARFVLDQDGQYSVRFITTDDDTNLAALPRTIKVWEDQPPTVKLTEPGPEITLPANGTLRVKGEVSDDIGVKEVSLHLRLADGTVLQAKPYRDGKSLQLGAHGYPKKLEPDYQDFVALDQVKDAQGKPFALKKGMVLDSWVEAADACDYPAPHRVESDHFKVKILDPATNKEQQKKEREQVAKDQKEHDKKEDQQRKEEEKKREQEAEQAKEQKNGGQSDKGKGDQGSGNGGGAERNPKPNDQSGGAGEKGVEKDLNIKEKQDQSERGKSGTKGPQDGKGESKDEGKNDKGDAKPQSKPGDKSEGGTKDEGKTPQGQDADKGGAKSDGGQSQGAQAGDAKSKGPDDSQGAASEKPDEAAKSGKGGAKDQGKGDGGTDAGAAKEQSSSQGGKDEGGAKGAGSDKGDARDKATAKGDQPAQPRGDVKSAKTPAEAGGGTKGEGPNKTAKAESKSGGSEKGGGPKEAATAKDDPSKRDLASAVKDWEKQVQGGTEKEKTNAEKHLDDLARNAQDKGVRDLAQKVLDKAREDRSSAPALPRDPIDTSKGPASEAKGQGDPKETSTAKGGKPNGMEAKGTGKTDEAKGIARGGNPGGPGSTITPADQATMQGFTAVETEPLPVDPAHRRFAGSMQIENFRSIDKQIILKFLKDHNITPEQWNAYARRRAAELEQLPESQRDKLNNRGARDVKSEKGDPSGVKTDLGDVPPEFRALYNDYTRRQSEKK